MLGSREEHFFGKVAQKALIVRDGKVLITRDSRDVDSWELPGGRLNMKEDPKIGLIRELKEELGVDFVVGDVVSVKQFWHRGGSAQTLLLVYTVEPVDPKVEFNVDPIEISEMAWVDKDIWRNYKLFPEIEELLAEYFKTI